MGCGVGVALELSCGVACGISCNVGVACEISLGVGVACEMSLGVGVACGLSCVASLLEKPFIYNITYILLSTFRFKHFNAMRRYPSYKHCWL